jgi:hypothetical protein
MVRIEAEEDASERSVRVYLRSRAGQLEVVGIDRA